ncbi:MAG: hypothetical protein U9R51_00785 [Actinomycetota bacterium]|nr:hypothetical protein [Actinomycetota bacterium]
MRRKLSVVLVMIVVLSLAAIAPVNAKAPLVGEMDLEFNLAWPGPQDVVPDWVGTVTFDGDEFGIAFFLLGTGKPFEVDPPGQAGFFGEIWRIYDGLDYELVDGVLTVFEPGPVVMWGYDTGMVSLKNSKYHMNGSVEYAGHDFEEWLGRSVHMGGVIEWYDFGAPQFAPGTFRLN